MIARDILHNKCDELYNMINCLAIRENSDEKLFSLNEAIINLKTQGVECLDELVQQLNDFHVNIWNGYNNHTIQILAIFLRFLAAQLNPEDWDAEIDGIDEYALSDSEETRRIGNIFYCSSDDPNNEMILINCDDINQIIAFLERIGNIQEMVLRAVYFLDLKKHYHSILVAKENIDDKKINSKIEYLKMYAVLKGETFHIMSPTTFHQVALPAKYDNDIEYTQYSEIIDVLNEFNAQNHIIDKYLRIYQVVENFMYKTLICELCEMKNYERLTLSDFRTISDRLQTSETRALSDFLLKALKVEVDGKTFEERLKDSWNECFVSPEDRLDKVENFVRKIGITNKLGVFWNVRNIENNITEITNLFTKLIYQTRCSIVHNKVNEYHITYMNLDDDIKWVMDNYLIPNLVEISYGLMLNQNDVVMFKKDSITLI